MENEIVHNDDTLTFLNYSIKEFTADPAFEIQLEPLPHQNETYFEWREVPESVKNELSQLNETVSWPEDFAANSVESLGTPVVSSVHDDRWYLSLRDLHSTNTKASNTWEGVVDPSFIETCELISQAGPRAFDLSLSICDRNEEAFRSVKYDNFLSSLSQLGLGRESILFAYSKTGEFVWRVDKARVIGLSFPATESITATFGRCGEAFRRLRSLSFNIYRRANFPACTVALAQLSSAILLRLEAMIIAKMPAESVLQLQDAFRLPSRVLELVKDLFEASHKVENDRDVLSLIFEKAEEVERSDKRLTGLMKKIIEHVSKPWLDALGSCIGLTEQRPGSAQTIQKLENTFDWSATLDDETTFDETFPSFFSHVDRQLVMQIFQAMKVLNSEGKSGSFSSMKSQSRGLQWLFTWEKIVEAEKQFHYRFKPAGQIKHTCASLNDENQEILLEGDGSSFMFQPRLAAIESSQPLSSGFDNAMNDTLTDTMDNWDVIDERAIEPTFEIVARSSFNPCLAHRAREVNLASLKELFYINFTTDNGHSRNLTFHLKILRHYILIGHGIFANRLSQALFDSSLKSAERSEGHVRAGKMGLRVSSRSGWPPASSELQLVLAGILASSFVEEGPLGASSATKELPGNLSFALRQLSEEEVERCLDPESLEALDFLKIQYTPPRPLDTVILSETLDKYDQISRLVLRLKRLMFIVNHALRIPRISSSRPVIDPIATRLAHAAHHFVSAFSEYVFMSAIAQPWKKLMSTVKALENFVRDDKRTAKSAEFLPDSSHITEVYGIGYIRRIHNEALDEMLFACLLRQRHEKVRRLLEDNFRIILRFAAIKQNYTEGLNCKSEREIEELYCRFQNQTCLFVRVCKGLTARNERGNEKENGLEALLARLTINDFYVK